MFLRLQGTPGDDLGDEDHLFLCFINPSPNEMDDVWVFQVF